MASKSFIWGIKSLTAAHIIIHLVFKFHFSKVIINYGFIQTMATKNSLYQLNFIPLFDDRHPNHITQISGWEWGDLAKEV